MYDLMASVQLFPLARLLFSRLYTRKLRVHVFVCVYIYKHTYRYIHNCLILRMLFAYMYALIQNILYTCIHTYTNTSSHPLQCSEIFSQRVKPCHCLGLAIVVLPMYVHVCMCVYAVLFICQGIYRFARMYVCIYASSIYLSLRVYTHCPIRMQIHTSMFHA
jgi:hypothetical protein